MAIFQNAGSGYRDASKAMSIKALQSRMKAAQEAAAQATQVQNPIPDVGSGIAHLAGVAAAGFGQSQAENAEAAGRQQLAQTMAGINPDTGPTPEQMAQIYSSDPDMGGKMYEQAMQARAAAKAQEDAQAHALTMQGGQQTFQASQTDKTIAATAEQNELNRQADIARAEAQEAAANGRQDDAQAAAERLARINAELDVQKAKDADAAKLAAIPAETNAREAEAARLGLKPGTQEFNDYVLTGDYTTPDKLKPTDAFTPGQQEVDKKFAPEVLDWDTAGGANAVKDITQVNKAIEILQGGDHASGLARAVVEGYSPEIISKYINRDTNTARDAIRDTVQQTLRATLGAQFTEKEGTSLMERAFDINQPPEENIRRAGILLKQIQTIAQNKTAMVDYFKKNGSLTGYTGPTVDTTALVNLDFGDDGGGGGGASTAPAAGAPTGGAPTMEPGDEEGDTGTDDAGNKWVVRGGRWVQG